MNRAFSAWRFNRMNALGGCPRLMMSRAFGAKDVSDTRPLLAEHLPVASLANLTKVPHFQRSPHDFSSPRYSQIGCPPFHYLRRIGLTFRLLSYQGSHYAFPCK